METTTNTMWLLRYSMYISIAHQQHTKLACGHTVVKHVYNVFQRFLFHSVNSSGLRNEQLLRLHKSGLKYDSS